jgi:gamma-glutamyltranspeptidase / glutathione hydrolase
MYLNSQGDVDSALSLESYLAIGVPGTVKGFEYVLKKYGSMSRHQVMQPAIELASQGFQLGEGDVHLLEAASATFNRHPNVSKIFLKQGHKSYKAGDRLIQKNLAKTLTLISTRGDSAFYSGKIAREIVRASHENNGILNLADFQNYTVEETPPVKCSYRGYVVLSAPLPGGGVTLCEMLNILEGYNLRASGFHSPESLHHLLSAMLYSFADRNRYLGDPNFSQDPSKTLLSKDYARFLRTKIPNETAIDPAPLYNNLTHEGANTTHYSVFDRFGNAVSVTYTINSYFGSGLMAGETGFFLNNEMNDFTLKSGTANDFGLIQSSANRIEPGKRPLSSMSPTVVLWQGKPFLITGSPGGSTIPNTVLQVLTNVIDYNMTLDAAVNSPRFHYQGLPNFVLTEPYGIKNDAFLNLWNKGYRVIPFTNFGVAESIGIEPTTGEIDAVHDGRRSAGRALAY